MLRRRSFWIIAIVLLLAAVGARGFVKSRQAAANTQVSAKVEAPPLQFLPLDLLTATPRDLRQTL